ncbi:MAG: ABC transporter substrate-binding protein [Candidatus Paceibacterota bacterium]|jgi:branched-chain amino acid transport system substrate-binding protein
MNKTWKVIVWIVIVVLVVWGAVALLNKNSIDSSETIKIGFLGPLTGDLATPGINAQAAVSIAVDEINKTGGVLGKKLEVVYEDDLCTGATGANAISKLINTDKVVAVLGGLCSGATLGEAPIAEAAQTVQIAYCSTAPAVSQAGDYIFRNVPSDFFQAKYVAQYLTEKGKNNVALLTVKNDWGDGLNKAFVDAFTGTIVVNDSFDPNTKDFKTQLTQIKAKNPDAIYFIGYADVTIPALKQAYDLGIKTQFFGADGWDDTKIWDELGNIGDGAMYTIVGTNSSDAFKTAMKAKLGKDDLIYCSNYAYDGLKILANAINKAGSTDKVAVKDAMYETNYTNGVGSKEVKFDNNGDPISATYTVKIVKNGKAEDLK